MGLWVEGLGFWVSWFGVLFLGFDFLSLWFRVLVWVLGLGRFFGIRWIRFAVFVFIFCGNSGFKSFMCGFVAFLVHYFSCRLFKASVLLSGHWNGDWSFCFW